MNREEGKRERRQKRDPNALLVFFVCVCFSILCEPVKWCVAVWSVCVAVWSVCVAVWSVCVAVWSVCVAVWSVCVAVWSVCVGREGGEGLIRHRARPSKRRRPLFFVHFTKTFPFICPGASAPRRAPPPSRRSTQVSAARVRRAPRSRWGGEGGPPPAFFRSARKQPLPRPKTTARAPAAAAGARYLSTRVLCGSWGGERQHGGRGRVGWPRGPRPARAPVHPLPLLSLTTRQDLHSLPPDQTNRRKQRTQPFPQ